eukprot:TRINITY_DN6743_c0_g4_i1.p1 TRINITY_DN6743_c0_g4~~TRINITY_DN6743_c0_g4_i1.p1  ORF type:complete len:396 (+),score=44.76 TRINITY_DN6743_c0_g4_i1:42-1190(+)
MCIRDSIRTEISKAIEARRNECRSMFGYIRTTPQMITITSHQAGPATYIAASSPTRQSPSKAKQGEEVKKMQECRICTGEFDANAEIVIFGGKSHEICKECYGKYLESRINVSMVKEIKCPHCEIKIAEEVLKLLAPPASYEKLKRFQRDREISEDPNLRWCPNPKCSRILVIGNRDAINEFTCEFCAFKFCLSCNNPPHPDQSCVTFLEQQMKGWIASRKVQMCQKCKSLVEKNEGCNHMTCAICKAEWCWICGAVYTIVGVHPNNSCSMSPTTRADPMRFLMREPETNERFINKLLGCINSLIIAFFLIILGFLFFPFAFAIRVLEKIERMKVVIKCLLFFLLLPVGECVYVLRLITALPLYLIRRVNPIRELERFLALQ